MELPLRRGPVLAANTPGPLEHQGRQGEGGDLGVKCRGGGTFALGGVVHGLLVDGFIVDTFIIDG